MDYTNYKLNFEAPLVEIMSAAIAQGNIDIPNSMPVADKILYSHARIVDVSSTCTDGTLSIDATVNFIVVYCDRDENKHSLEAKTAFSHSMSYPAIGEDMWADIRCDCTNEECRNTTASTIAAQCVVEISGWAYVEQSVEIAQANSSEDDSVQTKSEDVSWIQSMVKAIGDSTIRQDIRIEEGKPSINTVLDNSATYIIENVQVKQGSVIIDGYASVEIIYAHDTGISKTSARLENQIILENPDIVAGEIVCPQVHIKYIDTKIYEDENGKRKILSIEMPLYTKVLQEVPEQKQVVIDAYGLKAPITLEYLDIDLPQKTIKIEKRNCQISTVIALDDRFEDKNIYSLGNVSVETVVVDASKVTVSGVLALRVWSEDGQYENCQSLYTLEINIDNKLETSVFECEALLKSTSIYKNNSNEWVCNAELDVNVLASSRKSISLVSQIQIGEEYTGDRYPLMLVITSSDDTLWTIARRTRATSEDIISLNPHLATEPIVAGSPVIVYRR